MQGTPTPPRGHPFLTLLFSIRRRPRAVLALLLGVQLLHGTYGINQDLVWGHSAFHMGEYGTQAVHLRRHGSFIPAESDEFRPPRRDELELRHPFLLHPYIAVFQILFGERPWTARIVPLLFSFLALGGMWSLVRRTRDVLTAHLATALFVLSPLNLAFSHLPEYQISAIAWTLWSFVGVHETLQRPTAKSISLWLGCAALAGLTDWPWFEVAFFFALFIGWRLRPRGPIEQSHDARAVRSMRAALAGFCVVVLVTFAQHFVIVRHLGQLEALRTSFTARGTGYTLRQFYDIAKVRMPMLHTAPVLVAATLWGLRALLARPRDLATALFTSLFFGMTLDIRMFPGAFTTHEYRDAYWYVPVFAFAAADLVLDAARWLGRRARSPRFAPLIPVAAAVTATVALALAAPSMLRLSRTRGGSVSMVDHEPHLAYFTLARIAHHLARGHKVYVGSGVEERGDFQWLLEAPSERLGSIQPLLDAAARHEFVVAIDRADALRFYLQWAEVGRQAQVLLFEGYAVAVIAPRASPSVEAVALAFAPRRPLDAWLHAEHTEPILVPGDERDAAAFASAISASPEMFGRSLHGKHPLLRQIPTHARSRGTR